jgi:hypothetical protein
MYTIRAPGAALCPSENCTMRLEVGMKREMVVCGRGGGRASPSTEATGASESRVPLDRLNSCANSRFTCHGNATY